MAGDWIKMRVDLREDPTVFKIAEAIGDDDLTIVGRLFSFWAWADKHAVDGRVDGAATKLIDRVVGKVGFADALVDAGWLILDASGASIPNFDRHNGESAKERSLKNARQARWRAGKDKTSSTSVVAEPSTDPSTREEKRREEKTEEKKPRKARVSLPESTLSEYLASCKAESRKPIPEGHPVRAYCEEAGITDEMRQVAWLVFKDRHLNADKTKTYRDWAGAFANSVKARWYRLWSVNESGSADWTPNGLQEKRVIEARMNKEAEHAPA